MTVDGRSLADRVARLEALEEIRQLFFAYGYNLDNRNWDDFSQLCAEW